LFIVPRNPSPVPLEDRPIGELTVGELRELLRRQREQSVHIKQEGEVRIKQEGEVRIKRERIQDSTFEEEDDGNGDGVEIIEPPPKKQKTPAIDLTGDD
jgi:hypothetical protein